MNYRTHRFSPVSFAPFTKLSASADPRTDLFTFDFSSKRKRKSKAAIAVKDQQSDNDSLQNDGTSTSKIAKKQRLHVNSTDSGEINSSIESPGTNKNEVSKASTSKTKKKLKTKALPDVVEEALQRKVNSKPEGKDPPDDCRENDAIPKAEVKKKRKNRIKNSADSEEALKNNESPAESIVTHSKINKRPKTKALAEVDDEVSSGKVLSSTSSSTSVNQQSDLDSVKNDGPSTSKIRKKQRLHVISSDLQEVYSSSESSVASQNEKSKASNSKTKKSVAKSVPEFFEDPSTKKTRSKPGHEDISDSEKESERVEIHQTKLIVGIDSDQQTATEVMSNSDYDIANAQPSPTKFKKPKRLVIDSSESDEELFPIKENKIPLDIIDSSSVSNSKASEISNGLAPTEIIDEDIAVLNPSPPPKPEVFDVQSEIENADEEESVEIIVEENESEYMSLRNSHIMGTRIAFAKQFSESVATFMDYETFRSGETVDYDGVTSARCSMSDTLLMGYYKIQPRTVMPLDIVEDSTLTLFVISGAVKVKSVGGYTVKDGVKVLHGIEFATGSCICIPSNTGYTLENWRNVAAMIGFNCIKNPQS